MLSTASLPARGAVAAGAASSGGTSLGKEVDLYFSRTVDAVQDLKEAIFRGATKQLLQVGGPGWLFCFSRAKMKVWELSRHGQSLGQVDQMCQGVGRVAGFNLLIVCGEHASVRGQAFLQVSCYCTALLPTATLLGPSMNAPPAPHAPGHV